MRRIILITGVPSTGKTTVSRILVEKIDVLHIDLSKLAIEKDLIIENDMKRSTKIVNMKKLRSVIQNMIKDVDRDLIVEGHYAHEIVDPQFVEKTFVLRRAPWKLKKELESRGYTKSKIMENIESEILGVCLVEALDSQNKVCEIDTTGKTPKEVVENILSVLEGKIYCNWGTVDWSNNPRTLKLIEEMGSVSGC